MALALVVSSCSSADTVVRPGDVANSTEPQAVADVAATPVPESTATPIAAPPATSTSEPEEPVIADSGDPEPADEVNPAEVASEIESADPAGDTASESDDAAPDPTPEPEHEPQSDPDPEPEPEPAPPPIFKSEEVTPVLNDLIHQYEGTFGIALATQDGQFFFESWADESMEAASIYKVPVMVEVFRQIEDGRFGLDTGVLIVEGFFVEGSDNLGFDAIGGYFDVETLLYLMIVFSSNVASYALLDLVGSTNVNLTMQHYGLNGIEIRWSPLIDRPPLYPPGYEPEPPEEDIQDDNLDGSPEPDDFPIDDDREPIPIPIPVSPLTESIGRPGLGISPTERADISHNVVTARHVAQLLVLILNGQAISEGASHQMLDLLRAQQIQGGLRRQLPDGAVAHKTGYLLDGVVNDAGIIFTPAGPVVAVVLTENVREDQAYWVMSEVGRVVFAIGAEAANNGP